MAVAFSGGRDSLALLHATCRAAQALGLQVAALHIHHGLLPEADAWLQRAQRLRSSVPYTTSSPTLPACLLRRWTSWLDKALVLAKRRLVCWLAVPAAGPPVTY